MRRSRVRFPLLASSRKPLRSEGFRLFLRFEKCVKKGLFLRFVYYLSTTREMGYKNWVVKTFNNRYNKRNRQYLKYAYIK